MPAREYRWRHLALLISILLLFVVAPFVVPLHHGILVMNVISAAVLVAGSYALSERKQLFAIAVVLSAITIAGTGLLIAFPRPWTLLVSHSYIIVLVAFFGITIRSYVWIAAELPPTKSLPRFVSICCLDMAGPLFTRFFWSATTSEVARNDYVNRILQLRYFSFMTLTTVGYGDIVPRSPAARTMTILEAVMGQFYLVALVGRLVGLHIVHGSDPRSRA